MRTLKDYVVLGFKGAAMGAADVVPGVSGGTIAFITGIYEELLSTINSFNFGLIKTFRDKGFAYVWKEINGWFLVALFSGIAVSVITLANIIGGLLQNYPHQLWSFFFGLIIASIVYIGKQIPKLNFSSLIGILIGTSIVLGVSILPPLGSSESLIYIFICGVIAICAMILPGISGSFLLLILGVYPTILGAVSDKDFAILGALGLGCVVGLLSFSRGLKWIFKNYNNLTLSVLTGFLIGSIYKLWPWRHIERIFIKHHGEPNEEVISLVDTPVLPNNYDRIIREDAIITGYSKVDPDLLLCISLMVSGFLIIFIMERVANRKSSPI